MSVRKLTTRSLLFIATAAAVAVPLAAQDTTRLRRPSEQRINTSKGEVALPPRVDTVFVTRYDTVTIRNTVTRIDTVMVTPPAPPPRILNEWFWSVFSGASAPISTIDRLYSNGFHFGVGGGWDPRDSWFGARVGVAYNQFGREAGFPVFLADDIIDGDDIIDFDDLNGGTPATWQFTLDLKAKWPTGGWSPYLVGGVGFNAYRNLATVADAEDLDVIFDPDDDIVRFEDNTFCRRENIDLDDIGENESFNCFRLPDDDTKFAWNFGVGTDFHIGSQDMFFEWRWNPIRTHGAWTWYMPVSLGVRFF
jgi:hypothetical protein